MTPIEMAIADRVAGLPPVVAIAGPRVYLDRLPQSPIYPCFRIGLVDDLSGTHLRGPIGRGTARIQVDAFAEHVSGEDPYQTASDLAAAIHGDGLGQSASGLSGFLGTIGGSPGLEVLGCFPIDRRAQYDPAELRVVTISHDYRVEYRRP